MASSAGGERRKKELKGKKDEGPGAEGTPAGVCPPVSTALGGSGQLEEGVRALESLRSKVAKEKKILEEKVAAL